MVLAGDTLFVAGPHGATHKSLEAFYGKEGISLHAISTADGSTMARYDLTALPVHDGMAAAGKQLYLVTRDGRVSCYAGQ